MGRRAPGPYADSAAVYIAEKFGSYGLSQVNGSWFQQVNLGYVSLGEKNHLTAYQSGEQKNFRIKDDFVPYKHTGSSSSEGTLIFCGYGIDAPEYNYNDYKDADVKGKIVLLLKHEPQESDTASVFNGTKLTQYSSVEHKTTTAIKKGAAGVIIINDPLNHSSMKAIGFPWPSLSKIIPDDALPLTLLTENNIPVVDAGEELIKYVFGSVQDLKDIQQKIDKEMTGYSQEFPDIKISLTTSVNIQETPSSNVIAFLEGSGSLKDELLIIGAHYDHSGIKKNTTEGDSILNGADDNASGTAGLMAIARAFSQLEKKPLRSILFIAFTAEEMGLFGSRYYVENPLFPLENTAAMINLDMIGRNEREKVYVYGSRSPELLKINEEENEYIGLTLIHEPESLLSTSDHAPFLNKGIPALFYHSGMHEDYHKVTDESSKIDFTKASVISQLAFRTAYRIANDSNRYKITGTSSIIF
jgi:hypothetical protein